MEPLVHYHRWEDIPPHLQTRTQLARQGLRPARGQEPAALIERSYRGDTWTYDLYDVGQAIPKRQPTPAQLAALETARQRAHHARYYGTCGMCGDTEVPREVLAKFGQCWACQAAEKEAQRQEDEAAARRWARRMLRDPRALVLDTETTDLDGEVIEIALLTMQGEVLFESLVRPVGEISPGAQAVARADPGGPGRRAVLAPDPCPGCRPAHRGQLGDHLQCGL
jgi:DNA polymerase-3 subunit epsilon